MKKTIIAGLAAAALGIGGLAPAVATADTGTDAFLDVLHTQGIGHEDGDGMLIAEGELVCEYLRHGHSPLHVARMVYLNSDLIDPANAGYFVGASIAAFCPVFMPDNTAGSSVV